MKPHELSDLRRRLAKGHEVDEVTGCWVWQRATSVGYGRIKYDGRLGLAHRASYEVHVGPIPAGLQIDHLCRNRACINPEHLEPVTRSENMRRAQPYIGRPDVCMRGHNDHHVNPSGQRQCRACKALTARRRRMIADLESRLVLIDRLAA